MPRAVWTPIAETDLDDILFYIGIVDQNSATAGRIFREIIARIDEYASGRLTGTHHPDAPQGWLYLRHKRWLIFYQPHPDGIEVMRVIDAARDLPRQLRLD